MKTNPHLFARRDRFVIWAANQILRLSSKRYRDLVAASIYFGIKSVVDTEKQSDLRSRSDIAYVAGHLEGYASMLGRLGTKANLRALVEALREDAEKLKQLAGGDES